MKKIIIALIILACLFFGICMPVYAENVIIGTKEANEVLEPDKDLILEGLKKYDETADNSIILYDRAIATCLSADIFSMETINNETMYDYMKQAVIAYDIPVECDQTNIILKIGKGDPVTDEDRQIYPQEYIDYYEMLSGRWNINGIQEWDFKFDYINHINRLLEENNISNSNVYLVGSIAVNLDLVAVICRENSDTEFLILDGWDADSKRISFDNPDNTLYTYDELKGFAQIWGPEYENYIGGGSSTNINNKTVSGNNSVQYSLIAGGAVLFVSAAALIINFASKKKHKAAE